MFKYCSAAMTDSKAKALVVAGLLTEARICGLISDTDCALTTDGWRLYDRVRLSGVRITEAECLAKLKRLDNLRFVGFRCDLAVLARLLVIVQDDQFPGNIARIRKRSADA